jgi:hypothetical protein
MFVFFYFTSPCFIFVNFFINKTKTSIPKVINTRDEGCRGTTLF